jgi:hypothetical protein
MYTWPIKAFTLAAIVFSSSIAFAEPPSGAHPRPMVTEQLDDKDMASLSLEVGYAYKERGEGDLIHPINQTDQIPMLLRAQLTPLLELRAGATPVLQRDNAYPNSTIVEAGTLLNFLPPTAVSPGFGFLIRAMVPTDDTAYPHFADMDMRLISTINLMGMMLLDINAGYWFGMGGMFGCDGGNCDSSPNHFIPFHLAARLPLFGLVNLYAESENYLMLDDKIGESISSVAFGGQLEFSDSLALDFGMSLGVTDHADDLSVRTGLRWSFIQF